MIYTRAKVFCPRPRRVLSLQTLTSPSLPCGNIRRMGMFLLWAMLGIYAVGVVAVCLVAVILPLITNADAGQR